MRIDLIDSPPKPSIQHRNEDHDIDQNLFTPARRAALEALEREFHDLLQTAAR
ncbi:MAG: hypothetical protein K9G60_04200 [Pseudolabrys sp.]|nr:hypothetical protein [Pseudolabrys sp.]